MRVLEAAKPARVLTVSALLALVCEVENCRFTMHGVACDAETVMSPSMFLPVLAWEVQELSDALALVFGPGLSPARAARAEAVRWQLEELRVSLFAQQLGTSETVSAKRIRKALAEI